MGIAVIFPGQGTQAPGVGRPWRNTPMWDLVDRAECAIGLPLAPLLLDASEEELSRTRDAQMCVFLASLLAWEAVRDDIGAPVAFAGHSLGQVTALVAAGVLDLDDGVRLAWRRAECTQEAADRRPGRMAAFLGAGLDVVESACDGAGDCWLANDNAPGQVVVGGTAEGVDEAGRRAREMGVRRVVPLNVGAAFHTPLMSEAATALAPDLAAASFSRGSAPVVCNVDGAAHLDVDWEPRLATHLVSPVRWRRSMATLVQLGADSFLEVGRGGVLSGLARRTFPDVATRTVALPDDVPALAEVGS